MRISEYAKKHGIHIRSAYNRFEKGQIPGAYKEKGQIIVPDELIRPDDCVIAYYGNEVGKTSKLIREKIEEDERKPEYEICGLDDLNELIYFKQITHVYYVHGISDGFIQALKLFRPNLEFILVK